MAGQLRYATVIESMDPNYQDKLPPGWATASVGSAGEVRLGRQRSPDKHSGRFPTKYLRAANITSEGFDLSTILEMDFDPVEREVFALRPGDILLAEASGSASQVGRAALWAGEIPECCYQNTVIRFRPSIALPDYALVVFRQYAASGEFARAARGIGIQHLGAARFAEMPFPLPPTAEQLRIAKEVDRRLSEAREADKALRSALTHIHDQNLEILAAAAYGDLLDSVNTPLHAPEVLQEEPASHTPPPKPGRLQMGLFEQPAREASPRPAPMQKLPEGWSWKTVSEVGELKLGRQRSPKHERGEHPTPYLRVANVQEDAIDFDDLTLMNFTPEEQETYRLRRGDILLNSGQSPELVGRPAMIREDIPLVCFQNHLIRFRPYAFLNGEYALLVFRHYLHSGVFQSVARWSTNLATLSLANLGALPFPLPPVRDQDRIVAAAAVRLDASREQEQAVRMSLDRLSSLRKEVLDAAVAGMLVPQVEQDTPAISLLLERGATPSDTSQKRTATRRKKEHRMKDLQPSPAPNGSLREALLAAGRPLLITELFSLAGYDRDATEDIERFYLTLRNELNKTVRVMSGSGEDARLEAMTDAS